MRFSIIVPVYNVEKYVGKCMDSLVNQTFKDFEVILVDDESPDNSVAVIQPYVDADPERIRLIHQKNTRQGGARNRGVREARGEYILFVDSDDYVRLDMLEVVDKNLKENLCDILVFKHAVVTEKGEFLGEVGFYGMQPGVYDPKKDIDVVKLPNGPVDKAYRRSFYLESNVQFPEKILYEDGVVRSLYAKASSIVLCDECMYYYVQREGSTMHQKVSEKMLDILTVTDLVCNAFREDNTYTLFKEPLEYSLIVSILAIVNIVNCDNPRSKLQLPMIDYIVKYFPDYRSNSYLTEKMKSAIDCLAAHRFQKYHFQYILMNDIKAALLRFSVVKKLNQLRKRLRPSSH